MNAHLPLALALLLSGGVATAPSATSPASEARAVPSAIDDATLIARVDALVQEAIDLPESVGLSVGVSIGNRLVHSAGYGSAELEHKVPANKDTLFRIGSITKQYTAAAICRLAEQDKLTFDDLIQDHLPDYDTHGKEVTLRHLLTHTSGIFSYTSVGPEWSDFIALDLTHDELLAHVSSRPLEFEPGTKFNYSNTGYFLLGMVIEAASGQTYPKYLETEFQEPLGLTRTRYGSNSDIIANRAQGYEHHGGGKFANDALISMTQPYAAGSLLSTGEDLVRWTMALTSGKVVGAESYEEMTTPFLLESGYDSPYGFGLGLSDIGGVPTINHSGGINGFNSMMMYDPESGLCVAVISNSEGFSAGKLATELFSALQK
jgi:D-alanyl-D-alanine carboxypeptidase